MKTKIKKFDKKKQDFFVSNSSLLFKKIRRVQNSLFTRLFDILEDLTIDNSGKIKFTASNLKKVKDIELLIDTFQQGELRKIGIWLGNKMIDLFGINQRYFSSIVQKSTGTDEKVSKLVMSRLGFNVEKKKLVKDGWLDKLTSKTNIAEQIGININRAISAKISLKDFKKQFKKSFTSTEKGLGILERHFHTKSFDIFQETDRLTAKTYADEYKLNFAIYSGTIKDTTRPFCKSRIQKVYHRDEIEQWVNLDFQGKPKGFYDPFTQCGGYNCRHHLSWISDELAKELQSQ